MSSSCLLKLPSFHSSPIKPLHIFASNHCIPSKIPILRIRETSKSHLGWWNSRVLGSTPSFAKAKNFSSHAVQWDGICEEEQIQPAGQSDSGARTKLRSFESFLNGMSKWLVAFLYGLVLLLKHDAEVAWIVMGATLNSHLCFGLKKILNQERPVPGLRSDPGMPSSHAQSISYAAVSVISSLVCSLGINRLSMAIGSTSFLAASYFIWLRVSQELHTASQALVGAALGCSSSITWLWLWHSFVLQAYSANLWIRILIVLGIVAFSMTILEHAISLRHWLQDKHLR